jgi:type IV secretory pathway TrbD component
LALATGGGTFNLFGSLLTGLLMFAALYVFSRWATVADPRILRILLNSAKFRSRYDPAKVVLE